MQRSENINLNGMQTNPDTRYPCRTELTHIPLYPTLSPENCGYMPEMVYHNGEQISEPTIEENVVAVATNKDQDGRIISTSRLAVLRETKDGRIVPAQLHEGELGSIRVVTPEASRVHIIAETKNTQEGTINVFGTKLNKQPMAVKTLTHEEKQYLELLSWPEDEQPKNEKIIAAARQLGFNPENAIELDRLTLYGPEPDGGSQQREEIQYMLVADPNVLVNGIRIDAGSYRPLQPTHSRGVLALPGEAVPATPIAQIEGTPYKESSFLLIM